MLVLIGFLSISLIVLFTFSSFIPLVYLFIFSIVWLLSLNMFSNSSLFLTCTPSMHHDEISFVLFFLSLFVIYVCCLVSLQINCLSSLLFFSFISLLIICYEVFHLDNAFLLYFFYEASLIPIVFIVVNWGSYAERSISSVLILLYTLIFGAPFVLVLFSLFSSYSTFSLSLLSLSSPSSSLSISLIVLFTFSVNLPLYGLHQWLPIAHVEAPTFGSVILAALLLKLGGVGMFRCACLIDMFILRSMFIGYLLVASVWSFLVCCSQSDLNRLIAYSSVAHIIAVPFLILSDNLLSYQSLSMLILLHGVSSSLLFMLVGLVYSFYGTRQLVGIRGLLLLSPLLSFVAIFSFFSTISAPPFPSFFAEVFFILSSYMLSSFTIPMFILMVFLGLLYNLNWLSSLLFFSPSSSSHSSSIVVYSSVMPLFLFVFISFFILVSISIF